MNGFYRYGVLSIWNRFDIYGMNFTFAFSEVYVRKKLYIESFPMKRKNVCNLIGNHF